MQRVLGFLSLSVVLVACGGDDAAQPGKPSISQVIGSGGGELELAEGGKVEIPENALAEAATIKITELDFADLPPLPNNLEAAGKPYAFEPTDLALAAPVKITLPFTGSADDVRPIKLADKEDPLWTTVFPSMTTADMKLELGTTSFGIFVSARPRRGSGVITLPDGAIATPDAALPDATLPDADVTDAATADANLSDAASMLDAAVPDASGDANMFACDCDPLVTCIGLPSDPSCGPCPTGYLGDGVSGCIPALTGLTVTPGLLLPAFDFVRTTYLINVGFDDAQTTLTAVAPPGSTITIDTPLTGPNWLSPVLAVGPNDFTLNVDEPGRSSSNYAFRINRGVVQEAVVRQNVAQSGAFAGWSIAVSGDTLIVGASGESSNALNVDGDPTNTDANSSGAAFVFARNGSSWTQQAYLKPGALGSDGFGTAVATVGDTVVVGSPNEDSNATGVNGDENNDLTLTSGAAYVFVRNGDTWTRQAFLKASNTGDGDRFGSALAMSGDTIVIGAPQERSNATGVDGNQTNNSLVGAGAAYVFVRSGTTWTQQAYLKASNSRLSHGFGASVSISGDTIVIGAMGDNSNATGVNGNQADLSASQAGAAYVFVRSGTTWTQEAYLKASNAAAGQQFGESVAVSNDTIVIGARFDGSDATGINGNQSSAGLYGVGAAFVFDRVGATWSQSAYLKASNARANALFGDAVAISGDTIAVCADGESSDAIGVNGDESPGTQTNPGAIYEFVRTGGVWSQRSFIKSDAADNQNEFGWSLALDNGTIVVGAPQESTGDIYSGAAWVFR